jgi:hypothetical protein
MAGIRGNSLSISLYRYVCAIIGLLSTERVFFKDILGKERFQEYIDLGVDRYHMGSRIFGTQSQQASVSFIVSFLGPEGKIHEIGLP